MNALLVSKVKYIVLAVLLAGGATFFFQNDEKYIRKKTIKLINLAVPPVVSPSNTALFRRIHEIAKYIHFSVQYKINFGHTVYQNRSLSKLRSLMTVYFKKNSNWKVEKPLKENIHITISPAEGNKTAEVNFNITITRENKQLSCKALLHWIKEKKWLIHKMELSSCSSN